MMLYLRSKGLFGQTFGVRKAKEIICVGSKNEIIIVIYNP